MTDTSDTLFHMAGAAQSVGPDVPVRNEGVFIRVPPESRGALLDLAKLLRDDNRAIDRLRYFVGEHGVKDRDDLAERVALLEHRIHQIHQAVNGEGDATTGNDDRGQEVERLSSIASNVRETAAAFNAAVEAAQDAGIMVMGRVRSVRLAETDEHRFALKSPLTVACMVGIGKTETA